MFRLAHVSWAIADRAARQACDAFLIDVFGARIAHEILVTPATEHHGFDREEKLLVIGDTMLIPIAPAGRGLAPGSPIGDMLRRQARPGQWIGIALRVEDLAAAAAWFTARGFTLHRDRGMEDRYFLIARREALGMRIEVMTGDLPGDPRTQPGWSPAWWRDEHPLGIVRLRSIGLSTTSLDAARAVFAGKLGLDALARREDPVDAAECESFRLGDTVIEAMQALHADSPLARHARDIQGIYCLTFEVRSAEAAARYLRGRGFDLVGEAHGRCAIRPDQACDRLIYFTASTAGNPAHSL